MAFGMAANLVIQHSRGPPGYATSGEFNDPIGAIFTLTLIPRWSGPNRHRLLASHHADEN
jgi:hypothetical protein